MDAKLSLKYNTQLYGLKDEFKKRFADFKTLDNDLSLIAAPFSIGCSKAPAEWQIELIDMQCDLAMKKTFLSIGWNKFFAAPSPEKFQNQKGFEMRYMWIVTTLGSTYISKQIFSTMNIDRSK